MASGNPPGPTPTSDKATERPAAENTTSLHRSSSSSGFSPSDAPKRPLFSSLDPEKISLNPQDYDKPFPYFRRPHILGSFSLDADRKFHHDRRQLKFFHESNLKDPKSFSNSYRRVRLDLNGGLDRVVRKPKSAKNEKLDRLLQWILLNRESFRVGPPSPEKSSPNGPPHFDNLSTDFVCYRGLLTAIMCTPYERREGWEFVAIRFRKTIYLCALETEQKRVSEENKTKRQADMASWGFKFEQFVLSDNIEARPEDGLDGDKILGPVNEGEEFCCIFRSRLAGFSVVYGAEMDGFRTVPERQNEDNKEMLDLNSDGQFVELKTSRVIDNRRLSNSFAQYKTLKWWAQSFLVGIPKILCGFRDDDGIVTQLEDFPIKSLPDMGHSWVPNVCMNFLKDFLNFVFNTMMSRNDDHDELVMCNFTWDPRYMKVRCEHQPYLSQNILPEWYTSKLFLEDNDTGTGKEMT